MNTRDDPTALERSLALPSSRPRALADEPPEGGLASRLLAPLFQRVQLAREAEERLVRAHQEGLVVHVLRSSRVVDPLFLLHLLARMGLPRPRWMHDHFARRREPTAPALVEGVRAGESALLFLRQKRNLVATRTDYEDNHVALLLELQAQLDRPILLVPLSLQASKRAGGLRPTLIDVTFGDRDAPGRMRELLGFVLRTGSTRFHVGNPVNLQAVLEREAGAPTSVVAKKVRWSILHHLAREEEIRVGPPQRPIERTYQLVLNDPAVARQIQAATGPAPRDGKGKSGRPRAPATPESERARGDKIVRRMAANMSYGWLRVVDALIDRVWTEIYDGIEIDGAGLARVREAARRGPVVLVPSHKSHVDYLVLSQVFFKNGMIPPHIAAGDNLDFWPVGHMFRRSGAFFIRRSFAGDKLYSAICTAYVRRLLKDGHAVEFFIEGGRSRTGKLLPPKLGILSMTVDPVLDGAVPDVSFVPVAISYERIIEARSYSHELGGGKKSKENVGALLQSRKVLRSKYGRVYVDFDEPISLRAFAAARGFEIKTRDAIEPSDPDAPPAERRTFVSQLGHRILFGINRVARVTPTGLAATVLLARTLRGLGERELQQRAERLVGVLLRAGATLSPSLGAETREAALREALGRLAADGELSILPAPDGENIYSLDDRGRRALDYYKNNVIHYLVPSAIVALALLAEPEVEGHTMPLAVAKGHAQRLSRLLKHEFSFSAAAAFEKSFDDALEILVAERIASRVQTPEGEDGVRVLAGGGVLARELAGQLAVFLEAYAVVAEVAERKLAERPTPEKELLAEALVVAQRQALEGRLRRSESASQATLQNAAKLLLDLGFLARADGGKLATGATPLAELRAELARYTRHLD